MRRAVTQISGVAGQRIELRVGPAHDRPARGDHELKRGAHYWGPGVATSSAPVGGLLHEYI
jgi:hypothetical protein